MLNILYDHQVFSWQKYGGISRYFCELMRHSNGLFNYQVGGIFRKNEYLKELNLPDEYPEQIKAQFGDNFNIHNNINRHDSITKAQNCDVFVPTYYEPYFLDNIKKPFVLTVYDFIHEIFPQLNLVSHKETLEMKKILIERATRIIAISENTKRDLLKFYPNTREEKISVVHLSTSWGNINKAQEKQEKYILYTGARTSYKNFPNFLNAVSPLLKKHNLKLKCSGDPWDSEDEKYFKKINIFDRCSAEFANEQELQQLYTNALCFVFPSLYEGFGIPILEAWACNCPLVLSNTSCFPELAKDAGVYFDPYKIEDIRKQIEKVILSESLRSELVAKGKERLKEFSWRKAAEQSAKVYEDCYNENACILVERQKKFPPILLIIFNRPEYLSKTIAAIREAKPSRIYIAADGPRQSKEGEKELCEQTRQFALNAIDWECEIKTNFQEKNLGCYLGVSTAISWFFDNEEQGIILEDDCVPNFAFFNYCSELLKKYKDEKKIWTIAGHNQLNQININESFCFTNKFVCWGWATWRDRWKSISLDLKDYNYKSLDNLQNEQYKAYWEQILFVMQSEFPVDTWDYRYALRGIEHNALHILPAKNLISNIGDVGVHFSGSNPFLHMATYNIENIIFPENIECNSEVQNALERMDSGYVKVFPKITDIPKNKVLYLAGRNASAFYQLKSMGLQITAFLEATPNLQEKHFHRIPIVSRLDTKIKNFFIVIADMENADSIAKMFENSGLKEREDFWKPCMLFPCVFLNNISNKTLAFPSKEFKMPHLKDIFGKDNKFFDGYSIQMPDFYVYNLEGGFCIGNREEVWTSNGELVIDHTTQRENPLKDAIIPFEQANKIKGTVFNLSLSYNLESNYGYWLIECLCRIVMLKKINIEPDFYIVSQETPFQREWLQILGIKKEKIITAGNYLFSADNLIFTTLINNYETTQYVNGYITFKKLWLPEFIGEMYKDIKKNAKAEKNIYISRANSYRRRLVNENEIMETLQKYDYEIVDLDKISVAEQIKIFGEAKRIIGIHGAGLANIFFAPPECKFFEIYPYEYYDPAFRIQAVALGMDYNYIIGEKFGEGDPQKRDMLLDKKIFEKALEKWHQQL